MDPTEAIRRRRGGRGVKVNPLAPIPHFFFTKLV